MRTLGSLTAVSILSLTLLPAAPAAADTVMLTADRDNTLYEFSDVPGRSEQGVTPPSNGAGESFFVGRTNQQVDSLRRGLLYFDVAAVVPAGATIDGVTLTLAMVQTIAGAEEVALHRLSSDWGEGTSVALSGGGGTGAPATAGDATWFHAFFPGSFWTTPGGDFLPAASATTTVDGDGSYSWGPTAAMTADVQAWLDAPASNFGWLLQGNEAAQPTAKRFASRENGDPGLRPMLVVDYTLAPVGGPAIPTLSPWGLAGLTALLLAAGWLLLGRRRAAGRFGA